MGGFSDYPHFPREAKANSLSVQKQGLQRAYREELGIQETWHAEMTQRSRVPGARQIQASPVDSGHSLCWKNYRL